jgi:hypothetical protein
MELLVVILNDKNIINDVLSAFVEAGISKATIYDSEGMGTFLAYKVPIFAGLQSLVGGSRKYNKTIISIIESNDALETLRRLLKKIGFEGIMFTVPVKDAVSGPATL